MHGYLLVSLPRWDFFQPSSAPAILQYAHGSPRQHSHPTGNADTRPPPFPDATAVIAGAAAAARSAGIGRAAVARFVWNSRQARTKLSAGPVSSFYRLRSHRATSVLAKDVKTVVTATKRGGRAFIRSLNSDRHLGAIKRTGAVHLLYLHIL